MSTAPKLGRQPVASRAARLGATGRAVKPGVREQAAKATRDSILRAATKVFAKHGYDGGSVEKISSAAKSYDRMIYYYFGSKEGLFIEVLEDMYRRMNEAELQLDLNVSQPVEALKAVIQFVLGYYRKNPEFVTLLNTGYRRAGPHSGEWRGAEAVPARPAGARCVPADRGHRLLLHVQPPHAFGLSRRRPGNT